MRFDSVTIICDRCGDVIGMRDDRYHDGSEHYCADCCRELGLPLQEWYDDPIYAEEEEEEDEAV